MLSRTFQLAVVLLCASLSSRELIAKSPKPSWEYPGVEIPGWHAQALTVAMREFQKNQGGKTERGEPVYGDLRHYTVDIRQSPPDMLPIEYEREQCVRITFAPALSAKDRREVITGGRTSYGIEVSYDVARRTMKIVKTSFAR
jgi:hypothetical protein